MLQPEPQDLRQAWTDLIVQSGPTHFLTLTFKHPSIIMRHGVETTKSKSISSWKLLDDQILRTSERLFTFMSRDLFRNKNFITGIGAVEYHKDENPHVHACIIADTDTNRIQESFTKVVKRSRKASRTHQVPDPFRILDINRGLVVRTIDDVRKDAEYTTKCHEPDMQGRMIKIGVSENRVVIMD